MGPPGVTLHCVTPLACASSDRKTRSRRGIATRLAIVVSAWMRKIHARKIVSRRHALCTRERGGRALERKISKYKFVKRILRRRGKKKMGRLENFRKMRTKKKGKKEKKKKRKKEKKKKAKKQKSKKAKKQKSKDGRAHRRGVAPRHSAPHSATLLLPPHRPIPPLLFFFFLWALLSGQNDHGACQSSRGSGRPRSFACGGAGQARRRRGPAGLRVPL